MPRTERQIWLRHKESCKHHGKPNVRSFKGCDCPVYARVTILNPDTDEVLFRWPDSSLHKLGIRNYEDAERLVDKWFRDYLSGSRVPQAEEERLNKTVREAVDSFLERLAARLKPKLKPWHGVDPTKHLTYKKYKVLLNKLVGWTSDHDATLLRQIDTDMLFRFQESWTGRRVKNPKTGEWFLAPKSDTGKDREQGLMRKFFQWCRKNKMLVEDPCENLERINPDESEPKPFTPQEEERMLGKISAVFPQKHEQVYAFVQLQKHSGARISAVATAELDQMEDEGIWLRERKTERNGPPNYVWCLLPPNVITILHNLKPKSPKYFFWSGGGTLKTLVTDWTDTLLKLYRAAGIAEKRSHEWRDTIGSDLQDAGADLEHIQAALTHKRKATTEKSYVGKNKRRYAEVDEYKRKMWGMAQSNTSPATTPGQSSNSLESLKEIERMFKDGSLTKREFAVWKKRIMQQQT
jgi:integrase